MTKPLLLDLCCSAGLASWGYSLAGFRVVGMDIKPQKNYPFEFIQRDITTLQAGELLHFDAIHASPPCQTHSKLKAMAGADKVDLIPFVLDLLNRANKPYIVENVIGSPLDGVMLCGSSFGLKVYRHRLFASNKLLLAPSHVPHNDKTPRAGYGISPKGFISVCGNGGTVGAAPDGFKNLREYAAFAMGVEHKVNRYDLSQGIPPAYTKFLGSQLIGWS